LTEVLRAPSRDERSHRGEARDAASRLLIDPGSDRGGVDGFAIRDLKVDVKIPRSGEAVSVEFIAPPAGKYEISCSEYCGSGHERMKAVLVSAAATQVERSISKE
jgi:hypothetical protein